MKWKVWIKKLIFGLLFLFLFVPQSKAFRLFKLPDKCTVEKILTGDTFICSGLPIKMIGVYAPKYFYFDGMFERCESYFSGKTWRFFVTDVEILFAFYKEAKEFLEKLIPPGTEVVLEFDKRKLPDLDDCEKKVWFAYVWKDGQLINEVVLAEGYARIYLDTPAKLLANVKYAKRLEEAYSSAVTNKKGLWGKLDLIKKKESN